MLELKKYQQKTLTELGKYISEMKKYDTEKAAGIAFILLTDKNYNRVPELKNSPFVCIKVPTAGGKTLIASHSVSTIFKNYLPERNDKGLVMWFVPSDAIKKQTINSLKDRKDHYREVLDQEFSNSVKIFDLSEAKAIKKDDLLNNLCIIISTLSAFKRNDKEWLKAYQDNGNLMNHFEDLNEDNIDFLDKNKEGNIVYSLANVIRLHNPLVIADEGHNIQTDLSFKMLEGLNPSFILEFTATPKGHSNALISISAQELKKEKMIKMPIFLANKTPWQDTIYEGIEKRNELEKKAKKIKKEYIRPIMIIQAEQEKENKDKVYVKRISEFLIKEAKIPEEQITIQTSKTKKMPEAKILLSSKCPIRYIITVNALREGWDCPFAYVLVSVSNLGARLSVEQTIGRIMRLPYAEEKEDKTLNSAYIFASTRNFSQTSDIIIKGLQGNGYEDVIPTKEGADIKIGEFNEFVKDDDKKIPYMSVEDGKLFRKLDYIGDLIGNRFVLKDQDYKVNFKIKEDRTITKIDIGKEGELIRHSAGKLNLIYHHKDFTKEDLLNWFLIKIQRSFISIGEMKMYLDKIVNFLLKKHKLDKLGANFYKLREEIDKKISEIIDDFTTNNFSKLEKDNLIKAKDKYFNFPKILKLTEICPDEFNKHLYEKAGKMNKEELNLAWKLDNLNNIYWWFRNPENTGFYIQGWLKNKFYPDFIAKTKKRNYFILEYKGEHLKKSEDTIYKNNIGEKWEKLSDKNYSFYLVDVKNIDDIINKISKL